MGDIDEGGRIMWVRVATFEGGDTEKLDKVMGERMSSGEMTTPEGMSSVLILDDQDAKKRKFFAFFDSRDALEAAESGFDRQGDTIPEEIRGKRTSIHYYDVPIYEGDVGAAKAARVSLLEGSSESIDAGLERTRGDTLPKVRAIDGNVGAIGLADRDNGRVSMITLWDSGDSMDASAQEADQLRQQTADMSDQKIGNVALYDVSMAQTVESARP
ncbi:MAG: hypothetical protein ACTHKS_05145 [Gaiellaceae bacterium]